MGESDREAHWMVYIVSCSDSRLYTGITNDLKNRIEAHNSGAGAKFTRGRRPVTLLYWEKCEDRSSATKRELQIKKLSRQKKIMLAAQSKD